MLNSVQVLFHIPYSVVHLPEFPMATATACHYPPTLNGERDIFNSTLLQASWKMRQRRQQRYLLVPSSVWSVWLRHFRSYVVRWRPFSAKSVPCSTLTVLTVMRAASGSFQYTYFRHNRNRNILHTQTKYSAGSMDFGTDHWDIHHLWLNFVQ